MKEGTDGWYGIFDASHPARARRGCFALGGHQAVSKPIRLLSGLACNTAIGYIALVLLNLIGGKIGITLGLSWVNALVIGVLGYPGLVLLLLLKYFF